MRLTMLFWALAMWSALAGAQTVVSGNLTTRTWTAAQSPYRVVGDTTVVAGNTLTVEPGVVVEFAAVDAAAAGLDTSRIEFNVAGTLAVTGTAVSPINFRAWIGTTPGTWYGIMVQSGGSASLSYFDIKHATYGVTTLAAGSGLQMSQGTVSASTQCGVSAILGAPVLTGVVLTGNIHGLCLSGFGATVTNSVMVGNALHGVFISPLSGAGGFSLNHLTVHGNGLNGVAVFTPVSGSPSVTIKNSLVTANAGSGISRSGSISLNASYNDVYGNTGGEYQNVTPGIASVSVDPHYVNAPADLRLAAGTPMCGGDDAVTQGALAALGPCNPRRSGDFNGDARADILWRNASTGENYLYFMNAASIVSEGYVRTVQDAAWRVVGTGDFNGDGKTDILWRNSSTGENYIYMMNGTVIVDEGFLRTVADASWRVVGVGDLNGDGRDDILWRNTITGENYAYLMNGVGITGEGYLRTVADQAWRVAGVGDFDRDGNADILWRNSATGENYVYFMNGPAIVNEGYLRSVPDAWQVKGVSDFDADGRSDILWRNTDTGENYIYFMDALTIAREGYLRTVADQNWQIAALGDYDGDFRSDILWRNTLTGDNYIYLMNALTIAGEGYVRSVVDQEWTIVNSGAAVTPPAVGSAGREFYLTFPDHMCVADPAPCSATPGANSLLISSLTQNSGVVSFMGTNTPFVVAAGAQVVVSIPTSAILTSSDIVESKGIRVTAVDPVSVQAVSVAGATPGSSSSFSADGYLALPANRLGTHYRVMTNATSEGVPLAGSAFAVVATKDNTTVSITPTAFGGIRPPFAPYQVVMNAGQTYQLFNPASSDMTGSLVSADKPVAVFGSHRCANIPSTTGFCDHLVEQLPDLTRLGKKFHVAPFAGRTRYLLRIMGTADGTQLSYDPALPGACVALQSGQFCDVFATTRHQILSTKPLLVAQYMLGSTDQGDGIGDPSMVLVSPVEQAVTDTRFSVYSLAGATQGPRVRVVMPTSGLATLKLDGVSVDPAVFTAIGSSGYSEGSIAAAAGVHRLQAGVPFTAMVYQSGQFASYAYPAASSMLVTSP